MATYSKPATLESGPLPPSFESLPYTASCEFKVWGHRDRRRGRNGSDEKQGDGGLDSDKPTKALGDLRAPVPEASPRRVVFTTMSMQSAVDVAVDAA